MICAYICKYYISTGDKNHHTGDKSNLIALLTDRKVPFLNLLVWRHKHRRQKKDLLCVVPQGLGRGKDIKDVLHKNVIAWRRKYSRCGLEKLYLSNNRKTEMNWRKYGSEDCEREIWMKGTKRKEVRYFSLIFWGQI